MAEGDFPKISGDILFASEINNLHDVVKLIYTGTDFNSTQSNIGIDSSEHELTAQGSTDRNHIFISATITAIASSNDSSAVGTAELEFQIKEVGDSYADIMSFVIVNRSSGSTNNNRSTQTIRVTSLLTAGMKTNGYQIKVLSKSTGSGHTSASASVTNVQTVVEES